MKITQTILIAFLCTIASNSQAMQKQNGNYGRKRKAESLAQALSLPSLVNCRSNNAQKFKKPTNRLRQSQHAQSNINGALSAAKGAIKIDDKQKSKKQATNTERKVAAEESVAAGTVKKIQVQPKLSSKQQVINLIQHVLPSSAVQNLIFLYARQWHNKSEKIGHGTKLALLPHQNEVLTISGGPRATLQCTRISDERKKSEMIAPHRQKWQLQDVIAFPDVNRFVSIESHATNENQQILSCYDAQTKQKLFEIKIPPMNGLPVFQSASRYIFASDEHLRLYDNDTCSKVVFDAEDEELWDGGGHCDVQCFACDGNHAIVAKKGGAMATWDLACDEDQNEVVEDFEWDVNARIKYIFPVSENRFVSIGNRLRLFERGRGKFNHVKQYKPHQDVITCAIKLTDGSIVTGSKDCRCARWNPDDESQKRIFKGHVGPITCLAQTQDGLLSGSQDATIRLWNIQNGSCLKKFDAHSAVVTISPSLDGNNFLAMSSNKAIKKWTKVSELETLLNTWKEKKEKDSKK